MKSHLRIVGLFITAAVISFAALTGCKTEDGTGVTTWVYNFTTDGDAIPGSAWFVDGSDMGETGYGYWLNLTRIAAPCLCIGQVEPNASPALASVA